METEFQVKTYIPNINIKSHFPKSKVVYTINYYTTGRTWTDSYVMLAIHLNMESTRHFVNLMQAKFNCYDSGDTLFFGTKKDCEEAIEFLDAILVMDKLIR